VKGRLRGLIRGSSGWTEEDNENSVMAVWGPIRDADPGLIVKERRHGPLDWCCGIG
jgi:hypothetical protein